MRANLVKKKFTFDGEEVGIALEPVVWGILEGGAAGKDKTLRDYVHCLLIRRPGMLNRASWLRHHAYELHQNTQTRGGITEEPKESEPASRTSGQVPHGDARLTANIRSDLHLKLKLAAAHQRITIGELIEKLVEGNL